MEGAGTDVRSRIVVAISEKPGIHMRELQRNLGISLSGITHHVRVLEERGEIVGISDGHYRRYFSSDLVLPTESRRLTEEDRRLLAECRRPMSLAIILNLAVEGRLRHADLCRLLRRSKSTISYHLSRLLDSLFVRAVRDSPFEFEYELVDRVRAVAVLVTFSGTLADHVDGFADLWLALRRRDDRDRLRP